jgi:P4 family phage/plasmid primase-like protien
LIERGFFPVPIPFREKRPVIEGWPDLRITAADVATYFNGAPQNIGVLLGEPYGAADIDLDCGEAIAAAATLAPATGLKFGRASKPASHLFYRCDPPMPSRKYLDPTDKACLCELRCLKSDGTVGLQTVVPPSTHKETGEAICFEPGLDREPANIDADELTAAVARIAAVALLARHWPAAGHGRHECELALAGCLARAGWSLDDAERFVLVTYRAVPDHDRSKLERVRQSVLSSFEKKNSDLPTTGFTKLCAAVGDVVARTATRWLGITADAGGAAAAQPGAGGATMPRMFPVTELGNAERFAHQHGANVRYCYDWRAWLVWDGIRWNRDAGAEVRRMAKQTVRSIYAEAAQQSAEGQRRALATWGTRSESAAAIESMLKLAQAEEGIPVTAGDLDVDRWLLNVENGTLDLRTGDLRPHRREDLISKLAPVDFDPAARCPRWARFMDEVFAPHPDIVPFIQRAVGYSLTGDTREECLFLNHGTGRNGKGTQLKTLALVMGDYAGTADFSTFVQRRDDSGPRDDVANMRGKRLVSAQESREGAALAESLLKWLTGGDLVRARRLYENSYEFDPSWKIWLATNHKPVIRGTDPAIWSRIKLVPFDVSFEGREDKTLKTALLAELPGILNWAVEGCLRWQEDGLQLPASVMDATAEYRADSDQTRRFITEVCIKGDYASGMGRTLYLAYRKWADDAGEDIVSATAFGLRLSEHGFAKQRTEKGMKYEGIGLRSDAKM